MALSPTSWNWRARTHLATGCLGADASADWISQVELATHELVENAVKGASKGQVRLRVEVRREGGELKLELRTWNHASVWNFACLRKAAGQVATAGDAEKYHIDLIRHIAGERGSGLGIGGVAAEAGMKLHCEVNDDEACVVARGERLDS